MKKQQPLLQFYSLGTFGYDLWDEEKIKDAGEKVVFQQKGGETRESFFKRVGAAPAHSEYGYDLKKDKLLHNLNKEIRLDLARQGYGLNFLLTDENDLIRQELARKEYGLDILAYDESPWVRAIVARKGHMLDVFLYDEVTEIRQIVAKKGHGLDILVGDRDPSVRCIVASKGFGLDELIYDNDPVVRAEVVRQGFGLDIVKVDLSKEVRETVRNYLWERGYPSLSSWIKENPEKLAYPEPPKNYLYGI